MAKRRQESEISPSPKKKFSKNMSLSAIDEVKSPKSRRKSPGKVKILQNVVITDLVIKQTRVTTSKKTPKKTNAIKLSAAKDNSVVATPVPKTPEKPDESDDAVLDELHIPKSNLKKIIKTLINNLEVNQDLPAEAPVLLFLQINAVKSPPVHHKIIRIPLVNSILTPDSDVCLIVPDAKGTKINKHLEHYEELLRSKHIECIKKIMTCHEFKTEYDTSEMKNKLVELYDCFLADGRIAGKAVRNCGSIFYKNRKVPSSVKLEAGKLKEHVETALSKVQMHLHSKTDRFEVQFGHNKMPVKSLRENVQSVLKVLRKEFPGGFSNVSSINVKSTRNETVLIYSAAENQNETANHVSELKIAKKVDTSERNEEQQLQNETKRLSKENKLRIKEKFKKLRDSS